jgi:hypothetical protein
VVVAAAAATVAVVPLPLPLLLLIIIMHAGIELLSIAASQIWLMHLFLGCPRLQGSHGDEDRVVPCGMVVVNQCFIAHATSIFRVESHGHGDGSMEAAQPLKHWFTTTILHNTTQHNNSENFEFSIALLFPLNQQHE